MKITENMPMAGYSSLKAGGPADKLVVLEAGDQLSEALKDIQAPVWVLGYGTNCLISDQGLRGTVIIDQVGQIEKLEPSLWRVDAGVNWDELVKESINDGLWGLELMSGIPGGVGAAVAGDIAAYGQKVADTLVEARLLNTRDGSIVTWPADKFDFDYRYSSLHQPANQHLVILDATFKLSDQSITELSYGSALKVAEELGLKTDSLENRRKIIMTARDRAGALLANITVGPWTAGSFFKNPLVSPDKIDALLSHEEFGLSREQVLNQNKVHSGSDIRVSAAHVLLAAGFERGQTWGQVRLHPDHILKIENLGQARAQDIYNVVQQIINTTKDKLGITLEPEVRFLGEF